MKTRGNWLKHSLCSWHGHYNIDVLEFYCTFSLTFLKNICDLIGLLQQLQRDLLNYLCVVIWAYLQRDLLIYVWWSGHILVGTQDILWWKCADVYCHLFSLASRTGNKFGLMVLPWAFFWTGLLLVTSLLSLQDLLVERKWEDYNSKIYVVSIHAFNCSKTNVSNLGANSDN